MSTRKTKPNKGLVNRKSINNAIDKRLYEAIDKLHKQTDIPKSKLLDRAIVLLLKEHGIPNPLEEDQDDQ